MKRVFLSITMLAAAAVYAFSQDCTMYFPMKEGVKFEITNYNAKGKEGSKALHTITGYEESGGNVVVDVTTEVDMDKKDEEPIIFEYQAMCENGKFKMNRFGGISADQLGMMEGSIDVQGDYLEIPDNPEAGQMLPDGQMVIALNSEEGMAMNLKYNITNRKVEGYETVETPSGSYEALKVSYDLSTKIVIAIQSKVAEWFVEGVGVVKSEQYNKKGKLQGYSLLTSIEGL